MPFQITIELDVNSELNAIRQKVADQILSNNHPILLAAASGVLSLVAYRIHTEGKRANGTPLGVYSSAYLRRRQTKYNRTADSKVIASLTRQMENDFSAVEDGNRIGLGFKNKTNFEKATYIEGMYPGTYLLSTDEERVVTDVINDFVNGIFA